MVIDLRLSELEMAERMKDIFSETDLIYRNSLLNKFILLYCRDANKETESKSYYYNKYTDFFN